MGVNSFTAGENTQAEGRNSVATGYKTKATGTNAAAFGEGSEAAGAVSFTAGLNNKASGQSSTALGNLSQATGAASFAGGLRTEASGVASTAMGDSTKATGVISTAMGWKTEASGRQSTAIGTLSKASAHSSFAAGSETEAYSLATGNNTESVGENSFSGGLRSQAIGDSSLDFGVDSKAKGRYAVALGEGSTASGKAATALGENSAAKGNNSFASMGGFAQGNNSLALGRGAFAQIDDSYTIGAGSIANRAAGMAGYLSNGRTGAEWKATGNAVSIGSVDNGVTRQITGAAAGTEDTDAVNVAQLKEMTKPVDWSGMGAQAAALAALKPMQYDPLEPTQIMAGYGNYRGSSALALGIAHYQNESKMINAGVSYGGHNKFMTNLGVTWKVGSGNKEEKQEEAYRKGPVTSVYVLEEVVRDLKAENHEQKEQIENLNKEVESLKALVNQLSSNF